eukprot:2434057-Prorocentrum_lima.AAC.1
MPAPCMAVEFPKKPGRVRGRGLFSPAIRPGFHRSVWDGGPSARPTSVLPSRFRSRFRDHLLLAIR